MKLRYVTLAAAAAMVLGLSGMASAVIQTEKSPAEKHLQDIGKQSGKYQSCIVKALQACEKKAAPANYNTQDCCIQGGAGCTLEKGDPGYDTPGVVVGYPDATAATKFTEAVAKCASKVNYMKKATDVNPVTAYENLGCPGDKLVNDPQNTWPFYAPSGFQRYADVNEWQGVGQVTTRDTIETLASIAGVIAAGEPINCTDLKCVDAQTKNFAKLVGSIQSCMSKCEYDHSLAPTKSGGGGESNDKELCSLDQTDPSTGEITARTTGGPMEACVTKAWDKYVAKGDIGLSGLITTLPGFLVGRINGAMDATHNGDGCL